MKKPKPIKYDCGCIATASAWLHTCDRHQQEEKEIHDRWQRERAELVSAKPKPGSLAELLSD